MAPSDHDRRGLSDGASEGKPTHANRPEGDRWLRSVVDNSSEIIKIVNVDGTLRFASPALERVLGYDPDEVIGTNVLDYVHPDDLPRVLEETEKAMMEGGVARNLAEYRYRHKDGSWRHVESVGTYLLDDPDVRGVVVNVRDVTERKEAERALKESEERFRSLVQNASDVIAVLDADGTVRYVSPAIEQILGYQPEDRTGQGGFELLHPEDLPRARHALKEILRSPGSTATLEVRVRHRDGFWRDVELTGTNLLEDPTVVGIVVNWRDVTERRRAEEALRNNEAKFRAVFDRAAIGMALVDAGGLTKQSNPALQEMLGYAEDELRDKHFAEFTHPDDVAKDTALFEGLISGELDHYRLEKRYFRKDGSIVWGQLTSSIIRSGGREPRLVVGMVEDITERKRFERSLEESERRFKSSFEDAATGMGLLAPDGRWLQVNDALCRIVGYTHEELLGKTFQEITHPDDLDADVDLVRRLLVGEIRTYQVEKRYLHKRGHEVWIFLSVSLVSGEDGEPLYFVAQVQDTSVRKRAEERLREAEEKYRTLVERIPVITYMEEPEAPNRTLYVSPQYEEILGYSTEKVVGDPGHWANVLHPEDRERMLAHDRRTNETGEPFRTEYRQFAKDGRTVWLRDEATLVRDQEGRALYWLGAQLDITERKEAEEALKESEERYRNQSRELALLHQARTVLAQELDLPNVLRGVVESIAETYGYTQVSAYLLEGEELVLQHQVGYHHVIDRIPLGRGVSGRAVRTGQPTLIEDVRGDPDFLGAIEGLTSEICVPLLDGDEAVGFINVESRDGVKLTPKDLELMVALGEHASMAVSRARLHTLVRNSEERFRVLTQYSSDLITLLEADGTIRYESPAIGRMLGYSSEELVGKNAFDYVHPEEVEEVRGAFVAGLEDTEWRPSAEYRFRHKDGSWRWLESIGTNLLGDPGVGEYVVNSRDVTERRLAEERLREAEERYRTLVEQIPAVTYVDRATSGPDESLYTSPQLESMLGYTPEEWREGRLWSERLHPDDRERILAADERFETEMEERFSEEYRLIARDGSVVWVREEAVVVRDEGDEPLYWQGVLYDITGHRRAEERLREAEERYRTVVEEQTELICRFLPDLTLTFVNDAYCRYFGEGAEELVGSSFLKHIPAEDRAYYEDESFRLSQENPTRTVEHRVLASDGEVRWQQWTDRAIFDAGGEPTEYQSVGRDITDRKEAEQALMKSEASLAEAQRLAHLGGWEWDKKTNEVFWSDEIYRIYGFAPQEFVPSLERLMEVVHPDDRTLLMGAIDGALKDHKPYDMEHRIVRPNGELRWVHRRAEAVVSESGEPLRMVGTIHDITERKALENRLRHQAFHDPLTDLPNRQLFVDRLEQALRHTRRPRERGVAVLFMDLDGFKVINDSLGHEVGDGLLQAVAERLRDSLRPEDTLARFGGDEFVVLLEDVHSPEDAVRVAERILEAHSEPFHLQGRELFAPVSIGVALGGALWKRSEDLLRDADTAMYEAKSEAASGYRVFDPAMHERVLGRLESENDLRRAIEQEEFVVHYQPIVSLQTGEVFAVEALVRWEHPELGLLEPSEFVAVAEASGLVIPMGEQVLREACFRTKGWQEEQPRTPPLAIAVNLSARQLSRPDLAETVEGILKETGLEGSSLTLDVTETVYVKALEGNTQALDKLGAMGVNISIDDFGTGYSSLSYLKKLPANAIKIDKSFVEGLRDDVEDTAIVRMVIELAHTLGKEVVAEGAESEEQARLLREMGCDLAQGFHFSKPLPPEAVSEFLAG